MKKTKGITQAFFNQVFDPIVIYHIDPEHPLSLEYTVVEDVNPAYEQVMKKSRDEVVGKRFFDVWPKSESHWGDLLLRCLTTKRAAHYEGTSPATGTYLEAVAFSLEKNRVAVIFFNKTQWKRAEEALQRSRIKLRSLATQLTLSEETTRREIATDIHDRVGYSLVSLLRNLRELEQELPDVYHQRLRTAQTEVSALIVESRNLIFRLSPPSLKDLGLNPALEALAENLLSPHGITWALQGNENDILAKSADDAVCILLFRMTRELLINVVKHSKATQVTLTVRRGPAKIQVMVEDNGCGFNPDEIVRDNDIGHYGLFSIRERLTSLGGQFNLLSSPGHGTTVVMTAPRELRG